MSGSAATGRPRIFLVEDHAVFRAGVKAELGDAVEHPPASWQGTPDEGPFEAALDEGTADAVDGDRSDLQGVTDLLVGP